MKLYERLNVPLNILDYESHAITLQIGLKEPRTVQDMPTKLYIRITGSSNAASAFYLLENKQKAIEYGKTVADYVLEYFYGDWREVVLTDEKTTDAGWWKKYGGWHGEFRTALLWSTCLGQWDKVKKLAEYPTKEVYNEKVRGQPEIGYPLVLAAVIRGESLESVEEFNKIVETGARKKEILLLGVLKTIVASDVTKFDEVFHSYLEYFKKREFPKEKLYGKLVIDGTILFNLARYKGLDVKFPKEYRDHFICLEQDK